MGQAAIANVIHRAEAEGRYLDLFLKPIHPDELIARLEAL